MYYPTISLEGLRYPTKNLSKMLVSRMRSEPMTSQIQSRNATYSRAISVYFHIMWMEQALVSQTLIKQLTKNVTYINKIKKTAEARS
jgi:hypothetical protein